MPYSAGMGARLRASAALSAGALLLHQLRYLAGHGAEAGSALAREGHGYLGLVGPLIGILFALALAHLAVSVQRRSAPEPGRGMARLWPLAAGSLLLIYVAQESLEGALVAGHPAGLAGLVGAGGWFALPLALVLGFVVALLLRGAEALLTALARRPGRFEAPRDIRCPAPPLTRAGAAVLARHLAGRAPPTASC